MSVSAPEEEVVLCWYYGYRVICRVDCFDIGECVAPDESGLQMRNSNVEKIPFASRRFLILSEDSPRREMA